jgi:hypothetical protein
MTAAYVPEGDREAVRTQINNAARFLARGGSGGKIQVVAAGPMKEHGPMSILVQRIVGQDVVSRIEMNKKGEITKDWQDNPYYTKYTYIPTGEQRRDLSGYNHTITIESSERLPYKPISDSQ